MCHIRGNVLIMKIDFCNIFVIYRVVQYGQKEIEEEEQYEYK